MNNKYSFSLDYTFYPTLTQVDIVSWKQGITLKYKNRKSIRYYDKNVELSHYIPEYTHIKKFPNLFECISHLRITMNKVDNKVFYDYTCYGIIGIGKKISHRKEKCSGEVTYENCNEINLEISPLVYQHEIFRFIFITPGEPKLISGIHNWLIWSMGTWAVSYNKKKYKDCIDKLEILEKDLFHKTYSEANEWIVTLI